MLTLFFGGGGGGGEKFSVALGVEISSGMFEIFSGGVKIFERG